MNFYFIFQKPYLSNLFYIVCFDFLVPTLSGFYVSSFFPRIILRYKEVLYLFHI